MSNIQQAIEEMKSMANRLLPYTFPCGDPPQVSFAEEQDVLVLKQRSLVVDGYEVTLCYSEADYGEYLLRSLQVQASQAPFLPFTLVCKIGKMFLGSKNLSYIEFFRGNRKVYCWTVKVRGGRKLPPGKKTKPGFYEGFQFNILQPGSVDLF
jgi:hypothetical protein